jgi:microcystin-dependent protein
MADTFVGQIHLFPFNFPPTGYAFCEGQLLPISQNTALFSLLGTTYGGDGKSTFALPDLRGRVALGEGQGPGLSSRLLGESDGDETVTLLASEIPAHSHAIDVSKLTAAAKSRNAAGNQQSPVGGVPASDAAGAPPSYSNAAPDSNMHAAAVTVGLSAAATDPAGSNLTHSNLQPYLTLHFCIALQGVFPPRS